MRIQIHNLIPVLTFKKNMFSGIKVRLGGYTTHTLLQSLLCGILGGGDCGAGPQGYRAHLAIPKLGNDVRQSVFSYLSLSCPLFLLYFLYCLLLWIRIRPTGIHISGSIALISTQSHFYITVKPAYHKSR
jgi:hypothetical protein